MARKLSLFEGASAELIQRAFLSLDKMSAVIVGICWTAALIMLAAALYTIHLASGESREIEAALAAEPSLPKIDIKAVDREEIKKLAERLMKRYPEGLTFAPSNEGFLSVTTTDATFFGDWITGIGYAQTIAPDIAWQFDRFCVGPECSNNTMMQAILKGTRISYKIPETGGH